MRTIQSVVRLSGAGLLALALAGCMVGPDFQRPVLPAGADVRPPDLALQTSALDVPDQWWTLFQSTRLNAAVARALTNNPDIAAAEASLRRARAQARIDRAALFPTIDAGLDVNRQKNPEVLASPLASDEDLFTTQTARLDFAYTLDLFGGVRRQLEASRALAEEQRQQLRAARLTLAANVVVAAIEEASLRARIDALRETVAGSARAFDIVQAQVRAGQVAPSDALAQETALTAAQTELAPLEKELRTVRDRLAILTGGYPNQPIPETFTFADLTLPSTLPAMAASDLVARRPDVRAAEARLHAAAAQVGVAIAATLPSITITGSAGSQGETFAAMFSQPNLFWSVTGGLAAPIFRGGALRAQARAARADYERAGAEYRAAVRDAFQSTAEALIALEEDARFLRICEHAARVAAQNLDVVRDRRRLGAADAVEVIVAEQADREASVQLSEARGAQYTNIVALLQALGGGWDASGTS